MQADRAEQVAGTPIRIGRNAGVVSVTIEPYQHADEFAGSGWLF